MAPFQILQLDHFSKQIIKSFHKLLQAAKVNNFWAGQHHIATQNLKDLAMLHLSFNYLWICVKTAEALEISKLPQFILKSTPSQ